MVRKTIVFLLMGILIVSGCYLGNKLTAMVVSDENNETSDKLNEESFDPCQIVGLNWYMDDKVITGGSTKIKVLGQCSGLKIVALNIDTGEELVSDSFGLSGYFIYYPQIYNKGRYILRAMQKGNIKFQNNETLWVKGDCQLKSENIVVKDKEYFKANAGYWTKNKEFVQFYAPTNGLCEGWKAKITFENKNNGIQYEPKEYYLNGNFVIFNETAETACLKNSKDCYSKYLVTIELTPEDTATTFLYVIPTRCRIENFTAKRFDTQNGFPIDMFFAPEDCEGINITLEFYPLTPKSDYKINPYDDVKFVPKSNSFTIDAKCLMDAWGNCADKSQYRITPRLYGEPLGEPIVVTVRAN